MSDIDFLANQQGDDQESKDQADKKEKIIWSEPDKDKPLIKEVPFSVLSFFSKKKEVKEPAAEQKLTIDKNKIRESRKEILQLIKRHKDSGTEKIKLPGQGLLAGLLEKLKQQPNHKDILIDYQKVLNQEKMKRNLVVDQLKASKFPAPARSAAKTIVEKKPVKQVVGPALIQKQVVKKESFFSRLFKMIKDSLAAAPRPKPRPSKINPAALPKNIKSPVVPPPPARSAPKAEPEIKPEPLKPAEPAKIIEEPMEVLETNLIKGEIITFFDWRRKVIILINSILIPMIIIAVTYFGLMYYQQQNQAKAQKRIKMSNELTAEITKAEVGLKEINDFQVRLKTVSKIFVQHIYWTNLFKFLEDNTITDVYYTGFSGDTKAVYSLGAVGARFSDISKQIGVLKDNEKITDVSTTGGEAISDDASNQGGVKFNLDFSILKSIFTE